MGEALAVLNVEIFACKGHIVLGKEAVHHFQGFVQHFAPDHVLGGGAEFGLELLTVGAQAHAQQQAAIGQVVQGGNLLGHDQGIPEGDDQQRGGHLQGGGTLGNGRQSEQRRIVPGGLPELLTHIVLAGDMVVAPHGMEAQFLRVDRDVHYLPCRGVGDRVHQTLGSSCNAKTKICLHLLMPSLIFIIPKASAPPDWARGPGQPEKQIPLNALSDFSAQDPDRRCLSL